MLKGISYLLKPLCEKLTQTKTSFFNADEDRRSTTVVFEWFLYLLELFPTPNLSALGAVFGCRFLIQVLRPFSLGVS
jgi:hypothetical protein